MIENQNFKENFFNSSLLNLRDKSTETILRKYLHDPAKILLNRPQKSLRSKLVYLGYEMAKELAGPDEKTESLVYKENLGHVETAIELIHTGSLIIDDIQDQSDVRRGSQSLHYQIGIPKSITVGNWLYFAPMTYLQRSLTFNELYLHWFVEAYFKTMEEAHCGQALDISIAASTVQQQHVRGLVRCISQMKTGSLTRLAITYGALCFRNNQRDLRVIKDLGESFGILLQAFDDIGNVQGLKDPEKKLEDVKKNRLTFILAVASEKLATTDYQKLVSFFGAPSIEEDFEKFFCQKNFKQHCDEIVEAKLLRFMQSVAKHFPRDSISFTQCKDLCEELKNAYT